jgi:TolB protein
MVCWGVLLVFVLVSKLWGAFIHEGTQIAFAALEEDTSITLYLTDIQRRMTIPLAFQTDRAISFSPTRQLIYSQPTDDATSAIFRLAGDQRVQLSPPGASDQYPVWSPDGEQIAFIVTDASSIRLFAMNADGSARRDLSHEACANIITVPVWLPDSRRIVFRYGRAELQTTCVVDSITGAVWDFTDETGIHGQPVWAADGIHVTYALENQNFANIYTAEVHGEQVINVRALTNTFRTFNTQPHWSPDGQQLVFISNRGGNRDLYTMDANGEQVLNVSNSHANDFFPVWSPSGQQIAFISNENGEWGIFLVNRDGTNRQRVTHGAARPVLLVWLP